MGADHFVAFYGVKFALDPDDEDAFEACGTGSDPRCVRAKHAGLETYTSRMTDGEDYFLFIGKRLAGIGLQADSHVAYSARSIAALSSDVDNKLKTAGFSGVPALHFQLEAQY